MYENEQYTHHLKNNKCDHCLKPLRTNLKHVNHYRNGFKPTMHKKCHTIALYLESFYE